MSMKNILPPIDPVIVRPKRAPFDSLDYQFDLKYDGFRAIASKDYDGKCRFMSKQKRSLMDFPLLQRQLEAILPPEPIILDGEICSFNEKGQPVLADLIRKSNATGNICYVAFDILWLGTHDLRKKPLEKRRGILESIVDLSLRKLRDTPIEGVNENKLRLCVSTRGTSKIFFARLCELDFEGLVAKRLSSTYSRGAPWFKIKNPAYSQEGDRKRIFSARNKKRTKVCDNGR
ncbi:MAG: hypothetical protein V4526_02760 [Patescibacteria group bacterium]